MNYAPLGGDSINAGHIHRVGVVVRLRLGRGRRLRLLGVIAVVVMPTEAVMVVLAVTGACRDELRVKVRTEVVSGGLAPAVCVAERSGLRQQHARQQHQGHDATVHEFLFGTEYLFNLTIPTGKTRSVSRVGPFHPSAQPPGDDERQAAVYVHRKKPGRQRKSWQFALELGWLAKGYAVSTAESFAMLVRTTRAMVEAM